MLLLINNATSRDKVGPWSPVVGESDPIHKPERKVNGCLGTTRQCSKRLNSSCLHRMVNQLEFWKLKFESKDLLFIAFRQKEKPEPHKTLHSLVRWAMYTR